MIHWTVINGIGQVNTVTCRTTGGAVVPLTGSEAFLCYYWAGETQVHQGPLDWVYNSPQYGTVDITITPAIAVSLQQGLYQWVLELPDASAAYARGAFEVVAGPGTGTSTITPYCSYADVLEYGQWVRFCAGPDSDQTGFLDKRLKARSWLDNVILANYRSTTNYGFQDVYGAFTRGWRRRSLSPDLYISGLLTANALILDDQVKRIVAYKTLGFVGKGQIGINNQYAAYGQYFDDQAEAECSTRTVMIDSNADGVGDIPVPLCSTNTLFT